MRGEGIGQAEHGCELRAVGRRAEHPDLDVLALAGHGANALAGLGRSEIVDQLDHVLREVVDAGVEIAAKRPRCQHVGAGRAAEPQVDAAGMKCRQRAELLCNDQRRMVGQHDAASTDADGRGAGGDMADDDRGRGARDARHVVVLGQPVAVVAEPLGMACEIERVPQRLAGGAAFRHGREIENGKHSHGDLPAQK